MLKRIAAACICCMACAGSIFAQERYTVEKVVAVVGNSAIKYSELMEARNMLVEERRKQGYTSDRDPVNEALEGLLVQKLLYNQADRLGNDQPRRRIGRSGVPSGGDDGTGRFDGCARDRDGDALL